jgi:Thioesterase-like superfamily
MAILSLPFSWRTTLLLLYLLANFKSLPFAWHIRILYHFLTNVSRKPIPPKPLPSPSSARKILTHPLFTPTQIKIHSPLLETDYNLHKSNSTYLTDMDVSRTKLITRLFSPAFKKLNIQLEGDGFRGRMVVALGGVHVTFRKEIGIYEKVGVRSRVLGWDGKWVIVVSYFVRRKQKKGGDGEELCAVGLSKYVLKKGRFTVKPKRVFEAAGWLPEKVGGEEEQLGRSGAKSNGFVDPGKSKSVKVNDGSAVSSSSASIETNDGEEGEGEGLKSAQIRELADTVVLDEHAAEAASRTADAISTMGGVGKTAGWNADAWSWEEIEEERLRGLQLAKGWLALDTELGEEFERLER